MQENVYDCIEDVACLVSEMRNRSKKRRDSSFFELEARFGILSSSCFQSGVTREEMNRIVQMMEGSSFLKRDDQSWNEQHDVSFRWKGEAYRTRVLFDATNMKICPSTIKKKKVGYADISQVAYNNIHCFDLRVGLKEEIPIPNDLLTSICIQPDHFRIKQTTRFLTLCGTWAFDLSTVWEGKTKTEAEKKQMKTDPSFEVECELADPSSLSSKSDRYVAASLLLKMHDLVPSPYATFFKPKVLKCFEEEAREEDLPLLPLASSHRRLQIQ